MFNAPYYQKRLRDELVGRVAKNPRYSLRAFARVLDLEPSTLSQILSGKRSISERLAEKIFEKLAMPPEERERFLLSLAKTKKTSGLRRISPNLKALLNKPSRLDMDAIRVRELSVDKFKIIADWYHYAILELTVTKGFNSDPHWIAKQLGISNSEVQAAINRLLELELLESRDGRLMKCEARYEAADKHLTTPALRARQKQVIEKSLHSLEHDPIECRNHSAMTLAIDPSKLDAAKLRIQNFVKELTEFLEQGSQERVYELTLNLFPLQIQTYKPQTPQKDVG